MPPYLEREAACIALMPSPIADAALPDANSPQFAAGNTPTLRSPGPIGQLLWSL